MLPTKESAEGLRARGFVAVSRWAEDGYNHTAQVQRLTDLGVPMFLRDETREREVWVHAGLLELIEARMGGMSHDAAQLVLRLAAETDDPLDRGTELLGAYLLGGRTALLDMLPLEERTRELGRIAEAEQRKRRGRW